MDPEEYYYIQEEFRKELDLYKELLRNIRESLYYGEDLEDKEIREFYTDVWNDIKLMIDKMLWDVRRPNAEYLIEIRKGKHDLKKLLDEAEGKMKELNKAFDGSSLPDKADRSFIMSLLPKLRKEFYESKRKD